ncbi:BRCA1 C Terminu BRCT domain-containing protein [Cladophialophora immunda]|nr:BRCA1 C Terminu BRCT domain-containing protein [Cladophialophora immunda]
MTDPSSSSADAQGPFQGKDDATALSATKQRRAKRKLMEIECADSGPEIVDAQSSISDGGASIDGIVSASPRGYSGGAPVVVFSGNTTIQEKGTAIETFERLGGKVSTEINKATILCIAEGPLKKTGKLIMAVAMGMDIVTEKWIADTHRLGRFPALEEYLPLDRSRERQWAFNLKDALNRGKTGLTDLLSGTTVFLTKQLRTDLGNLEREISQIATILGADAVKHRLPAIKDKAKFSEAKTLIIGIPGDPQGAHVGRLGHTLFNKDILIMAALRGRVERGSADFRIEVPIKDEVEDVRRVR